MSNDREQIRKRSAARLKRRYAADRRFRLYGAVAVLIACGALLVLLGNVAANGYTGFFRTTISLPVELTPERLGLGADRSPAALAQADYFTTIRGSLKEMFPDVPAAQRRKLAGLVSSIAEQELREAVLRQPERIGTVLNVELTASSPIDQLHKNLIDRSLPDGQRPIEDLLIGWYDQLAAQGRVSMVFNTLFFTRADSRSAELAGVGGAVLGSMFTLLVCLLISFPIGVAAAVYLEEFAPKNRWTELIEVNINNLAAVPSIIFGLLGLAILLNVFGLPRGTPLVGGAVLSLMTLPTIIIASRAALKAVPGSIRQGALAIGASPVQVVLHHVLPLALPGTLTGAILGLSRALGETAPLLMIGMVAFIANIPETAMEPSSVLPVQIYLWAESPERGFTEKTSAAIMVILTFLLCMNATAVMLRNRFERRW